MVTTNLSTPLMVGQTGNTLTCSVSGAERLSPTIIYQWTRKDGSTQTHVGSSRSFTLSRLTLTSAGEYACNITVSSDLLDSGIPVSTSTPQRVEIQSELNI